MNVAGTRVKPKNYAQTEVATEISDPAAEVSELKTLPISAQAVNGLHGFQNYMAHLDA